MSPAWPIDRDRLARTRFTRVRFHDEIGSTNAELIAEAGGGAPEGLVAVADHQVAGRGRMGRTWSAAPGRALLVSVLLRPELPVERWPLLGLVAGLAAADGVFSAAGFRPGLKWPNDLVVGSRKLAGLLAESTTAAGDGGAVVVGIGFNVSAGAYPEELAGVATSCEEVAGRPVDRAELLVAYLEALEDRYATALAPGGAEATVAAYRPESATLGRAVRVERAEGVVEGVATDLAGDGGLVVTGDDGTTVTLTTGDVIHLRSA